MLIEITKQTSIKGRPVRPGDRLDVDSSDARLLLGMNRAKPAVISDQLPEIPAEKPATEARKPRPRKPLTV